MCREVGWKPGEVQLIAVTVGPGSFTGLRIGVSTAKALAYALATPLIGVNTLEVILRQAPAGLPRLQAVLDAQRYELFAERQRLRRLLCASPLRISRWSECDGLPACNRAIG